MNKDFYNKLPGLVCFILDELIEKYENEEWFENAWNEYREHILKSNMNDMKMPGAIFNKYEIHNLLKIQNDKTTIFTNRELKMIDDYIKELESYKYNMDRDYLRLEKENQELKEKIDGIYEERTYLYNKLSTEKEQLNSLVNSCQEEIRQLKKQLEEYKKLGFEHLNDKYNKLEKSEYDDKF